MIPTDLLPRLDVFGQQAAAWIATWWIHSVLITTLLKSLKSGPQRKQAAVMILLKLFTLK